MGPCVFPISAARVRAGSSSSSSLIALIALAGVPTSGFTGTIGTILVAVGGALIVAGGVMAFLGVQALGSSFTPNPRPLERGELVQSGIYTSVRHPIYGGVVLGAAWLGLSQRQPAAASS